MYDTFALLFNYSLSKYYFVRHIEKFSMLYFYIPEFKKIGSGFDYDSFPCILELFATCLWLCI